MKKGDLVTVINPNSSYYGRKYTIVSIRENSFVECVSGRTGYDMLFYDYELKILNSKPMFELGESC